MNTHRQQDNRKHSVYITFDQPAQYGAEGERDTAQLPSGPEGHLSGTLQEGGSPRSAARLDLRSAARLRGDQSPRVFLSPSGNPPDRSAAMMTAHERNEAKNEDRADIREALGAAISAERIIQGVTVRELARFSGYSTSTIERIEEGKYAASVDILARIAAALGAKIIIQ